jgi:anti-sigma B factor antagonist
MTVADVQITYASAAVVAHVVGEVDMSNAEDLGAAVIAATSSETQGVVLDLSRVDYLDSAGIYVIHEMRASLHARGQRLVLVIPPRSPVHDTLRLAGVERPGQVAEELETALGTFAASPSTGS